MGGADIKSIVQVQHHIVADNERVKRYQSAQHGPQNITRTVKTPPEKIIVVLILGSVKNERKKPTKKHEKTVEMHLSITSPTHTFAKLKIQRSNKMSTALCAVGHFSTTPLT